MPQLAPHDRLHLRDDVEHAEGYTIAVRVYGKEMCGADVVRCGAVHVLAFVRFGGLLTTRLVPVFGHLSICKMFSSRPQDPR